MTDPPSGSRPRTIFLGSGQFGVESLRRLGDSPEVELVGVVTAPARPAGRGGGLTVTPVASAALELAVGNVLSPERLRSRDSIEAILALQPEMLVLADYGRLVPADLLDLPFGALNLHPSLLPRHRGASPIAATILAGDAESGVTLMKMDAGLDTGPIVAQSRVDLSGHETAPLLEDRLSREAETLLARSLGSWIRGEVRPTPQPDDGATLTRPLRRDDGRLDAARPAEFLERQVRAYQPWPGSFVETAMGRVIVWQAAAETASDAPRDMGVIGPGPDLRIATPDGWLVLNEVQPAGGRRMSGADLLRGRPVLAGSRVT